MPRRSPRKHEPIGPRLRTARNDAGLTLKDAADLTGISAASLSRFETNRSQPSFGDICLLAEKFGWPLLYFATGRLRTGTDGRALAAQLFHWGLRDLSISGRPVLGEVRAFEDVVPESVRDRAAVRLIEAVPALLLRNDFAAPELVASAKRYGTLQRVGWLSEVAEIISRKLEVRWIHPDAAANVHAAWRTAWTEVRQGAGREEVVEPVIFADRTPGDSPAVSRRWRIALDLSLDDFLTRARTILGAP